jgi:hypothetical protein
MVFSNMVVAIPNMLRAPVRKRRVCMLVEEPAKAFNRTVYRPLGALFFGRFGDMRGRKIALLRCTDVEGEREALGLSLRIKIGVTS